LLTSPTTMTFSKTSSRTSRICAVNCDTVNTGWRALVVFGLCTTDPLIVANQVYVRVDAACTYQLSRIRSGFPSPGRLGVYQLHSTVTFRYTSSVSKKFKVEMTPPQTYSLYLKQNSWSVWLSIYLPQSTFNVATDKPYIQPIAIPGGSIIYVDQIQIGPISDRS
jgi:hypothetical protein